MDSTEEERVAAVRAECPVLEAQVYLNSGTAGPLPRRTAEVITAQVERQLQIGRARFSIYLDEYLPLREELRGRFARVLGADPDEVALTHHTTEGMNIAIWGLNWRPGDEIVTTVHEHEAGLLPAYAAARRFGLTLRFVDLPGAPEEAAAVLTRALSPRTRLVVVSHVPFTTGAVLPLAAIAAAAHAAGALVAVDGAQSGGAIPLDVHTSGVDFYAITGQKWLCGVEGVGALYVRRDRIPELAPTFIGFFGLHGPEAMDLTGHFLPAAGAARYEQSTILWPGYFGMNTSLQWLEETLGWPWVYARTQTMTARCRAMLTSLPGVTVVSPPEHAGLTAFRVAGIDGPAAVDALAARNVVLRSVPIYGWLRVSTGFFTTDADLDRLREALLAVGAAA